MISFVVATAGRRPEGLAATIRSIELYPGDEIVVVGHVEEGEKDGVRCIPHPPGNDWGHTERNFAIHHCRGKYIAHIDDDDVYAPGTRKAMGYAIMRANGAPIMFRMRFPNGITLWREPCIRCGNVGTPMFLTPNEPEKFGTWGSFVGGDCHFLQTSKWPPDAWVWRPEVIALLGHNIG